MKCNGGDAEFFTEEEEGELGDVAGDEIFVPEGMMQEDPLLDSTEEELPIA